MQRRNTNQRQQVFDAIELLGHTTSEELIAYLMENQSDVSLATVYRNLTILSEDGKIKKIKVGTSDVYETVKEKHYHFVCNACGNIYDILPSMLGNISIPKYVDGNEIENEEIVLFGTCQECKKIN